MKNPLLLTLGLLLLHALAFGQLCTGSLGDPIINKTFGTKTTAPGPLKPGITSLGYIASSCPNDGQYTITTATSGCFSNSWYTISSDHTGDPGGQFMLINASVTPNDFYVDTVSGLCSNTNFEFAAWIMNIIRPSSCSGNSSKPNLTFRIETITGAVLLKYDTGDLPTEAGAIWKQYGTFFKTPSGVSTVVLRITNNAPGGCGNDLAMDDITFRPCGPLIQVTSANQPLTQLTVCENAQTAIPLNASFSNGSFSNPVIQWQQSIDSGKTWTAISGAQSLNYVRQPTTSGVYQYRVVIAESVNFSSEQCRVASNTSTIIVSPAPVLTAKTLTGCTGSALGFQTIGGAGYSYQWTGPNHFSSTAQSISIPQVNYRDSGTYRVSFVSSAACVDNDTFYLKVFPGVKAKVTSDTGICAGNSIALQALGGSNYNWAPAIGLSNTQIANPMANPADTTTYLVSVSNQYGCKDSASVTIYVYKNPFVNAGPDKTIFEGQSVTLNGSISGNYSSFYWLPNTYITNANSLTPEVSPADSVTYYLYAVPGSGCPAVSDKVFVKVYKKIIVPNAFSPNGDGINDTWIVKGLDTYPGAGIMIFSRGGAKVFETRLSGQGWDGSYNGKPLAVGTYYYIIDLNIGLPPVSGAVTILR